MLNFMVSKIISSYNSWLCDVENLTKEQYAGQYRPKLSIFSSSKDALNPSLNAEKLKNRLFVIDHYKYRYGVNHTYWVHSALAKSANKLNKYKFNYALKAFLAYNVYSKYKNYKFMDDMTFMSDTQRGEHYANVAFGSAAFTAACLLF